MNKKKLAVVKTTEKALMTLSEIFSIIPCQGRIYEPKLPQKLKK